MKSKTLKLMIQRFSLTSAVHWYVTRLDGAVLNDEHRKFIEYKDAREHALGLAYARNIITYG